MLTMTPTILTIEKPQGPTTTPDSAPERPVAVAGAPVENTSNMTAGAAASFVSAVRACRLDVVAAVMILLRSPVA